MTEWKTMTKLFDLTRTMAAEMAEGIPPDQFDIANGGANSPKWIVGHLALGMDFGLMLLGAPTDKIEVMMPTYGPGSPGGSVGADGLSQSDLIAHLRSTGDVLRDKVLEVESETLMQKQHTPFLVSELPTVGDLLGHVFTTHIAMHMGQLSQVRREAGLPSWFQVG